MPQSETTIPVEVQSEPTVVSETVAVVGEEKKQLPQMDSLHFASQLFWLFITFLLLYFVLSRSILPKIRSVLQDRQNRIQADLEQAGVLKDKAEAAKNEYESSLEHAQKKAAELIREAHATIDAEVKKRHLELDRTLETQMQQAEAKVASLVEETKAQLQPVSEELSEVILQKVLFARLMDR